MDNLKTDFERFGIFFGEHFDEIERSSDSVIFQYENAIQRLSTASDVLQHSVYLCKLGPSPRRSWVIASIWRSVLGVPFFRDQVRLRIETRNGSEWLLLTQPFALNHRFPFGCMDEQELRDLFTLWAGLRIKILRHAPCLLPAEPINKDRRVALAA